MRCPPPRGRAPGRPPSPQAAPCASPSPPCQATSTPSRRVGAGASTAQILGPTSGDPVRITHDGGWRVDTDYARSVEVVDEKPLTVRVRLNPDAVWQDGTPITAKDMREFQRAMSGGVKGLEVASTDGYDDIDSVKGGDDRFEYTVTFDTTRSDWPRLRLPAPPGRRVDQAQGVQPGIPHQGGAVQRAVRRDVRQCQDRNDHRGAQPALVGPQASSGEGGVAHRRPDCAGRGVRGRRARRRLGRRHHLRQGVRRRHGATSRRCPVVAPHPQWRTRTARERRRSPCCRRRDRPQGAGHRRCPRGRCARTHGRQSAPRAGSAWLQATSPARS